jgi:hypothetical protein
MTCKTILITLLVPVGVTTCLIGAAKIGEWREGARQDGPN